MSASALVMSASEARDLTEEVKRDAQALWTKLLYLYESSVHLALGYSSWGEYCAAEFDMGQSYAYRLLDSGRVVAELHAHSPIGERPANEAQARELAPLRDEPERMAEAWTEAQEHAAAEERPVTAAAVREIVRASNGKPTLSPTSPQSLPPAITTERQRRAAEGARGSIADAASIYGGQVRGLRHLKPEQACAVATNEEIQGWIFVFRETRAAILAVEKSIQAEIAARGTSS